MKEHSQELDEQRDAKNGHEYQRDGLQRQSLTNIIRAGKGDGQPVAALNSVGVLQSRNDGYEEGVN